MNQITPEIQRIFDAKEARRRKLAALPMTEKIRAIIKMQKLVAPILKARGRHIRIWPDPVNPE
jgi:hypothetical protein